MKKLLFISWILLATLLLGVTTISAAGNKDTYYGLIKEYLNTLVNNGEISQDQYNGELASYYQDIYEFNKDPVDMYSQVKKYFQNSNYDLVVKEFSIEYGKRISKIDFQICNIGTAGYLGDINAFIKLDKNNAFSDVTNKAFEYNFKVKIDVKECRNYSLDSIKVSSLIGNYPDYDYLVDGGFYGSIYVNSPTGVELNMQNNTRGAAMNYSSSSNIDKDKYYGLVKDLYTNLSGRGYIQKEEKDKYIDVAYQDIYKYGSDPEKIYNYALLQVKVIIQAFEDRNKYYELVSNTYLGLYNSSLITRQEQQNLIDKAFNDFFIVKLNPKDIYNESLTIKTKKIKGNIQVVNKPASNKPSTIDIQGSNKELRKDTYFGKISAIYALLISKNYISEETYNTKMIQSKTNIYVDGKNPATEYRNAVLFKSRVMKRR